LRVGDDSPPPDGSCQDGPFVMRSGMLVWKGLLGTWRDDSLGEGSGPDLISLSGREGGFIRPFGNHSTSI
jgi:hypothetical protein